MEIYSSLHHRKILTDLLQQRRLTFSALAQETGVQKTYVSKVMAGNACWSSDQAFLIGEYLGLEEDEALYFSLLVELERSGVEKRKQKIQEELKKLRRKHLRSQHSLQETTVPSEGAFPPEYFADPYHSLVHVFLSIPKFRRQTQQLASTLGIPLPHLHSIFGVLERMEVVRFDRKKDQVQLLKNSIHTPSGSASVMGHQQLFRAMAIDRIHRCPSDRKNNFSVAFTGDVHLQESIWAEFLNFVKRAQSISRDSTAKEVFYLQFDLFPWAAQYS